MSKSVAYMIAQGSEAVEVVSPLDVMRRGGLKVDLVSTTNTPDVTLSQGVAVRADAMIKDADLARYDMIVVPGGDEGVKNLSKCMPLKAALKTFMKEGKWVASICAGPTILADLHLLDGYTATCFPGCEQNFPEGAYVPLCVHVDRNLITASGPAYALDFGRAIVEALVDKKTADDVAKSMLFQQ